MTAIKPARRAKKATDKKAKPETAQLENGTDPERKEFVAAFEGEGRVIETRMISIKELHPSPFQPRKEFDEAELNELAALMKAHGQLTALKVRAAKKGFEIIAGERRWRAAPKAELTELRCDVVDWTDEQCFAKALIDNLGRSDLKPLERVQACRELLDRGVYTKQLDLAKSLGITPATLSNQLVVLDLPKEWLDWISQEKFGLAMTHGRVLARWVHRPALLESLRKWFVDEWAQRPQWQRDNEGDTITVDELTDELDRHILELTRPLQGYAHGVGEVLLTKANASDVELDLEEFSLHGVKQKRVWNVTLWQKYQDEGKQRKDARAAKASAKRDADPEDEGAAASAGDRRDSNYQRQLDESKEQQKAKRLYRHKVKVLQDKIRDRIETNGLSELDTLRLVLHFCGSDGTASSRVDRERTLIDLLGGKSLLRAMDTDHKSLATLATKASDDKVLEACRVALSAFWCDAPFEGYQAIKAPDIEAVAELLQVKFETDWQPTKEFLELLTTDDLWDLDNKWATHLKEQDHPTKKKLIEGLLASTAKRPLPDFMRKLKAVRL